MASIVEDTKKEEEASDSEDSEDYVHPLFRENLDSVGPPGPPAFYIAAPLPCLPPCCHHLASPPFEPASNSLRCLCADQDRHPVSCTCLHKPCLRTCWRHLFLLSHFSRSPSRYTRHPSYLIPFLGTLTERHPNAVPFPTQGKGLRFCSCSR